MIDTVLKTEALTKYYANDLALDHLDMSIPRGCICGFVGRNGPSTSFGSRVVEPSAGSSPGPGR